MGAVSYRTGNVVATGTGQGNRRPAQELEWLHDDIRRALGRGLSDSEVALAVDCSSRTVMRYRRRHGIAPYPRA